MCHSLPNLLSYQNFIVLYIYFNLLHNIQKCTYLMYIFGQVWTYILEKTMAPHSSILAWKIPWSLVGCSPWGREESDTTEQLPFHFSLSCIGEGNGNPLQCSCLENPRDGGAWWAAVCGVAQSWTRLKRLSSSSSMLLSVHPYSCFPKPKAYSLFCFPQVPL